MIISPGRKFIFVHAPKTGGTSLSLALEQRAKADDVLIGDTPKAVRRKSRVEKLTPNAAGRLWKHSTLADISGIADPSEMFVAMMVRNPWDRLVSYYHWLQEQNWDHPAVDAAHAHGFADFLRAPNILASFRAMPYRSYVTMADGTVKCDAYIRLETLGEDLAPFEQFLGFEFGTLPRENASDRGPYRDYYDRQTRYLVAENCAADIAQFGYVF